jgi:hypothetical protein
MGQSAEGLKKKKRKKPDSLILKNYGNSKKMFD